MLTAGARPKSRFSIDWKEFSMWLVVGLAVTLPVSIVVTLLVDRLALSDLNSATLRVLFTFSLSILIMRLLPIRKQFFRDNRAFLAFAAAFGSISHSGPGLHFSNLWPAYLVAVLMHVAYRKWELAVGESARDR